MTEFTNTKGSFWLFEARERQLNSNWAVIPAQQKSPIGFYGWYAGGQAPLNVVTSTVDRLSLASGTITSSSSYTYRSRGSSESARNTTAAYFGGGSTSLSLSPFVSTINKLTFNPETWATITPKLPVAMLNNSHVTDSTSFGWALSGQTAAPATPGANRAYSSATKIDFSNDGTSTIPSSLNTYGGSATSSTSYGWTFGGWIYSPVYLMMELTSNTVYFAFSNGTVGTQNSDLFTTAASTAAYDENQYQSFVIGGDTTGGSPSGSGISSIRKLNMSAGTFSASSSKYPAPLYGLNSKTIRTGAFISGGAQAPSVSSSINNLKFSTESVSTVPANLSTTKFAHWAV